MMSNPIMFDVTLFREQFPAYSNPANFSDAFLQMYWNEAINFVSNNNCGDLVNDGRVLALNLITAHLVALSVIVAAGQVPGLMQNATIDKVAIGLTPPPLPNQWQWWLNQTPYGQQLLSLLQANSVGGFFYGGVPQAAAFRNFGGIFY